MIANLSMYDLPGLEPHNDILWSAIADRLQAAGVDAPSRLTRNEPLTTLWTEPDLLLAQTCGYPLVKHLQGHVRLVSTPRYRARGCEGVNHRSVILVRTDDPRSSLNDFRGALCAVNDEASNTGMNLLRAEIAPLIGDEEPFFSDVILTGAHAASIEAVIGREADIAAVDCITFALLQRLDPERLADVRVLSFTAQTPGLPLITALSTPLEVVEVIRESLDAVARDPKLKPTLNALMIEGFVEVPVAHYRAILHAEQIALSQGYPKLQ